jgi:hypothetical protein
LVVGAVLAGIEGLVLVLFAVVEIFNLSMTAVFFLVYGAGLMWCAWTITRGSSWARSPIVLAQFIQLGLAFSRWGNTAISVGLGVSAVAVLAGLLHPASIDALAEDQ